MEMTCARLDSALAALIPRDCIHFGRKLVAIERNESTATLVFANGSRVDALLVVGADGIHSMVREALFGALIGYTIGRYASGWRRCSLTLPTRGDGIHLYGRGP